MSQASLLSAQTNVVADFFTRAFSTNRSIVLMVAGVALLVLLIDMMAVRFVQGRASRMLAELDRRDQEEAEQYEREMAERRAKEQKEKANETMQQTVLPDSDGTDSDDNGVCR